MAKSLMIVDDSATMRKIIMRTIRMSDLEFETTEEAGNGVEALEKLNANPVEIMLCDVNMPEMGGMELVKKVRELPACKNTKIIMVSTESSQELIDSVIADGANGFISKPFTPEKFQEKLEDTLVNNTIISERLTKREAEILQLVVSGKTNKEIARMVCRTQRTIEYHRNRLMRKLDAHNAADLVKRAIAMGVV